MRECVRGKAASGWVGRRSSRVIMGADRCPNVDKGAGRGGGVGVGVGVGATKNLSRHSVYANDLLLRPAMSLSPNTFPPATPCLCLPPFSLCSPTPSHSSLIPAYCVWHLFLLLFSVSTPCLASPRLPSPNLS